MAQRTRRGFLKYGAVLGPAFAALQPSVLFGQLQDAARTLGRGVSTYGARSRFETAVRLLRDSRHPEASSSRTPLQDLHGTITPSALHFERHHAGVPDIDPSTHRLLIHGLVERPIEFSLDDLKRLPTISRIYSLECSGNSGALWGAAGTSTAQSTHGLTSCSEWVGIPLSVLFQEVGVRQDATWLVAEGADASRLNRSLPLAKALDTTLVAFGQNGESLRPAEG